MSVQIARLSPWRREADQGHCYFPASPDMWHRLIRRRAGDGHTLTATETRPLRGDGTARNGLRNR